MCVINSSAQVPTITEHSSGCVLGLQRSNSPYLDSKQTLKSERHKTLQPSSPVHFQSQPVRLSLALHAIRIIVVCDFTLVRAITSVKGGGVIYCTL